jgi:Cft2 family RNA processing exonuclease
MTDALGDTVRRTCGRGGKVVIPSFALERAQEVIFALKRLRRDQRIPLVPVYVDSLLTVKLIAYSGEVGQAFRSKSSSDSGAKRPEVGAKRRWSEYD